MTRSTRSARRPSYAPAAAAARYRQQRALTGARIFLAVLALTTGVVGVVAAGACGWAAAQHGGTVPPSVVLASCAGVLWAVIICRRPWFKSNLDAIL